MYNCTLPNTYMYVYLNANQLKCFSIAAVTASAIADNSIDNSMEIKQVMYMNINIYI